MLVRKRNNADFVSFGTAMWTERWKVLAEQTVKTRPMNQQDMTKVSSSPPLISHSFESIRFPLQEGDNVAVHPYMMLDRMTLPSTLSLWIMSPRWKVHQYRYIANTCRTLS
jgi:hypothetical protein